MRDLTNLDFTLVSLGEDGEVLVINQLYVCDMLGHRLTLVRLVYLKAVQLNELVQAPHPHRAVQACRHEVG